LLFQKKLFSDLYIVKFLDSLATILFVYKYRCGYEEKENILNTNINIYKYKYFINIWKYFMRD